MRLIEVLILPGLETPLPELTQISHTHARHLGLSLFFWMLVVEQVALLLYDVSPDPYLIWGESKWAQTLGTQHQTGMVQLPSKPVEHSLRHYTHAKKM